MYIYRYIYTNVNMTCIYIEAHIPLYQWITIDAFLIMCIFSFIWICILVYTSTHIYMHTRTHICTYIYIYAHAYIYIYYMMHSKKYLYAYVNMLDEPRPAEGTSWAFALCPASSNEGGAKGCPGRGEEEEEGSQRWGKTEHIGKILRINVYND